MQNSSARLLKLDPAFLQALKLEALRKEVLDARDIVARNSRQPLFEQIACYMSVESTTSTDFLTHLQGLTHSLSLLHLPSASNLRPCLTNWFIVLWFITAATKHIWRRS